MEKEKVSSGVVLEYEEYKNIRKMLSSSSKSDNDMAIAILQSVDQKKCLPYILFIAVDLGNSRSRHDKEMLWEIYCNVKCLSSINRVINAKKKITQNPFDYKDPYHILRMLEHNDPDYRHTKMISRMNYIDAIVGHMTMMQVIDSILVSDEPERFYQLEDDIREFMIVNLIKRNKSHFDVDIPGFVIDFNLQEALKKRRDDLHTK